MIVVSIPVIRISVPFTIIAEIPSTPAASKMYIAQAVYEAIQIHIACARIINAIISQRIKRQRILSAIIINVNDRIAFGFNLNVLIKALQVESRVPIIVSINTRVSIITGALLDNSVNRASNISGQYDGVFEVISIRCKILLPDNDGILCFCLSNPASPDFRFVTQRLIEVICCSTRCLIRFCFARKPPTKRISITNHVRIIRLGRVVA